jgi:hypothetical protein
MRYDASVGEWLGLIRNAEYVFTNSFHGCVFSVMFRKNFYCYTRGKVTKKIEFICDKLALNERMITDGRIPEDKPIDWDKVYSVLEKEKEFSKRYLLDSLENIKNELNAK